MEGVEGVPFTLGVFGLAPAYTMTGFFHWSVVWFCDWQIISDCILTDFGVANLLGVGLASVYNIGFLIVFIGDVFLSHLVI